MKITTLQGALLTQATKAREIIFAAYTHLRRAQPALVSHALLAHVWRLARDADRLHDAFARINVSPAGAGAVAGTSLPLDVRLPAALLGFERVFSNSIDATSDRDALVEVTSVLALLSVHLSELAEDLVLWSSTEFGFLRLGAEDASGSSFLPNKRNPDVPELVRGQAGGVIGDLVALLTTLKGLPLGYNRDLQADKAPTFHAIDTISTTLGVLAGFVGRLSWVADRAVGTIDASQSAVLFVEFLVARGVPYREAYELIRPHIAELSSQSSEGSVVDLLHRISPLFDASALTLLTPHGAVAAVVSHGGTGPDAVAAQIHEAEATLGRQAYDLSVIAKRNARVGALLSGEAGP